VRATVAGGGNLVPEAADIAEGKRARLQVPQRSLLARHKVTESPWERLLCSLMTRVVKS